MKIIYRYLFWRFITTITGVFALCLLLIFLIDFIEILRRAGKVEGISMFTLLGITLLRVPSFAEMTMGFAVMIGTIGGFLTVSRSSELIIIRAVGMSVWQFLLPAVTAALLIGIFAITAYSPLAASSKAWSERLYADAFGRQSTIFSSKTEGAWLRQDGEDGPSVMNAGAVADKGLQLGNVLVIQYDRTDHFFERIEADQARLRNGYWILKNVLVTGRSGQPRKYGTYLVSTYLTPTQVTSSLGSEASISFWELPGYIRLVEKAGLSARKYKLRLQQLIARPILLVVMVLIAASCSLRPFRFGNIQTYVLAGLGFGFAFFLSAMIFRNVGLSGGASPEWVTWMPIAVAGLVAITILLHQEDG